MAIRLKIRLAANNDVILLRFQLSKRPLAFQKHAQVGRSGPVNCTLDANYFNRVIGFTKTRGIEKCDGNGVQVHSDLDHVTSGSRNFRGNGGVTTCQRIQKSRFASVGGAYDSNLKPRSNTFCHTKPLDFLIDGFDNATQQTFNIRRYVNRDLLIREIDRRFEQGHRVDQIIPPAFGLFT